jgi:hypothetical protein
MDTELNTGDAEFFEVLRKEGWKAKTSTVRKNTSLNNNQVNSRRRKFRDKGWVRDKNNGTDEKGRPEPSTIIVKDKSSVKTALKKHDTEETQFDSVDEGFQFTIDKISGLEEQIGELNGRIENVDSDNDEQIRKVREDIQELEGELDETKQQFNGLLNSLVEAQAETISELMAEDKGKIEQMLKQNLEDKR